MFDLWSKCWKVWCQSIVKYTRLLFGVKIMWVAFSFFRMTLQKTDEKLQQNLEREVLVCQICYLGSSTYHQSFKGSDHGFISFLSLSYRSSNVGSSMWLPAFWEHGFLCCWLKILGKTPLKKHIFLLALPPPPPARKLGNIFTFVFAPNSVKINFGNFSPLKKCQNQFGQGPPQFGQGFPPQIGQCPKD